MAAPNLCNVCVLRELELDGVARLSEPDRTEMQKRHLAQPPRHLTTPPAAPWSETDELPDADDLSTRFDQLKCERCARWVDKIKEPYAGGSCQACWKPYEHAHFYKTWLTFRDLDIRNRRRDRYLP